jgi:hypothetical protein
MKDPTPLLSTLTQAAAVFVAIVGGFLVSRLVAISSERDGLKRRHKEARDQLKHVRAAYQVAHEYRLSNSQRDFAGWVLEGVVGVPPESVDRDALLNKIPRGSSRDEMAPYLEDLITRVKEVTADVDTHLAAGDTNRLTLDDLEERGLVVRDEERNLYREVVDSIATKLPSPTPPAGYGLMPDLRIPHIVNPTYAAANMRRLDESISREQELEARMHILETEVERLRSEIALTGRPVGVTPAIVILAVYSLLGIVAPVVVLTLRPTTLAGWKEWALVALFVVGLFAVLGYILWYARTLDDVAVSDTDEQTETPTMSGGALS